MVFSPIIIAIAVFTFVVTAVVAVALSFSGKSWTELEDRLDFLTATGATGGRKSILNEETPTLLAQPLGEQKSLAELLFSHFGDLRVLLEQGGTNLSPTQFLVFSIALAAVGAGVCAVTGSPVWSIPVAGLFGALCPLMYVIFKRKRRLSKFGVQLPEALELISRALRAGHSLGAGFNLVGEEMADPIRTEFARCYEEQNLGIPLEDAIQSMTDRVPNLDLKFFATAITLQRQTGGDLAEILDKIGHLVRERFKIWGQIQALTGEGRLSGIVLLALPPVLFIVMYRLNQDYVMVLFRDELGKKLLAFAVFMQLIGAFVIRKIINIKV
jgi:tight adherence protein B